MKPELLWSSRVGTHERGATDINAMAVVVVPEGTPGPQALLMVARGNMQVSGRGCSD
jgi:hypothetical protein